MGKRKGISFKHKPGSIEDQAAWFLSRVAVVRSRV